jgi:N6-L-threonylcarbamoyladenine synthase
MELVLGVESSCDETAAAVVRAGREVLSSEVHSQVAEHAPFGGVVPEIAGRSHLRAVLPTIDAALETAGCTLDDLSGVAVTVRPGLIGSLLVGLSTAKALAFARGLPLVGVHHIEAHVYAATMEPPDDVTYPCLALVVSGGHTALYRAESALSMTQLARTLDDAAGEAFDKAAKMLGLDYPGGPNLARCAERGDSRRFRFPRPMTDRPGLDFSFSGLKTYTLNTVKAHQPLSDQDRADIACAFEDAVVDTLFIKCRRAIEQTGIHHLVMAGGVAANLRLREKLARSLDANVYFPEADLCTDNGAMVAHAGCLRLQGGDRTGLAIKARARWPITELAPPVGTT